MLSFPILVCIEFFILIIWGAGGAYVPDTSRQGVTFGAGLAAGLVLILMVLKAGA